MITQIPNSKTPYERERKEKGEERREKRKKRKKRKEKRKKKKEKKFTKFGGDACQKFHLERKFPLAKHESGF